MEKIKNYIIVCFLNISVLSNAQFVNLPGFGRTLPAIQKIAIGSILTNANVLAKLHVNEFVLATDLATSGELFRTDGTHANIIAWRMFAGTAGSLTEKFSVRNFPVGGSFNGNEVSIRGLDAEDEIFFQQARINMIVRSKTLGIFCENFGAAPDDVKLGDATDVNTTIFAQDFSLGVQKGLFLRGSNGNFRMGHFMIPFTYPNIEMDVISTAIDQMGSTNANQQDIVFQGRIHDDTLSNIRLMNGTVVNGELVPMIAGYNSNNYFINGKQGIVVSGAIKTGSDILSGDAVVEFDARKRNNNAGGAVITSKNLFQWCNFSVREMLMDAGGQLGIRTVGNPNNRLEINSQLGDPLFGPNGSSGLRLTNMRGGIGAGFAVPVANPSLGVLAVDGNGDVIYVSSGGNFGNICGSATPVPLTTNWEIPLATLTYNFSGDGVVNITSATNCAPTSKLFIDDNLYARTSIVRNGTGTPGNIAGMFIGSDPAKVHAIVVPPGRGNVGLGVLSPNTTYRLHVNGSFLLNGNFDGAGIQTYVSDQQFKTNIDSISNALDIINQLNPKSFYFDTTNVYGMNFSSRKQYGLIAQEVELILPELVSILRKTEERDSLGNIITASVDYKALNYNAFIAILMQGIKEQQSKIDSLKGENDVQDSINSSLQNQINQLASLINSCCSSSSMQQNSNLNNFVAPQCVNLNDAQIVVLQQNVPNPFAEQTTIDYSLPDSIVKAQMLFYNAQGKLIQSVDLNQRVNGSINVFAQDLSDGIYTYTIVVDGKIIETKKMIKQL